MKLSANGPDYEFGWGLMNTTTAAQKITEDQSKDVISELSLATGDTYTRDVHALGTEPLKVTIVWTDPPGTPVAAALDPLTSMLVNDLDLRVSGSTYYPWKLDRDNPSNAATNSGENDVDNVEVVYIPSPTAGIYTIIVDHDGTLSGGSQAFSMIISGIDDVPHYLSVDNVIVNSGQSVCSNAVNTLTVAESGPVVINSGGAAIYAAGYLIEFDVGFTAKPGSDVNAYITTNNFCSNPLPIVHNKEYTAEPNFVPEIVIDKNMDLRIYPNPNTGIFNIDFNNKEITADIIIVNLLGSIVHQVHCENQNKVNMDVSHLVQGIYIISIQSNNQMFTGKIIMK